MPGSIWTEPGWQRGVLPGTVWPAIVFSERSVCRDTDHSGLYFCHETDGKDAATEINRRQ